MPVKDRSGLGDIEVALGDCDVEFYKLNVRLHRYLLRLIKVLTARLAAELQGLKLTVLDMGVGFSTYSRSLARAFKGATFLCVDVDVEPLRFHAKRVGGLSNVTYINASAEHPPFKRNVAKLIVAVSVVEHLQNPQRFFEEAVDTLDGGGLLLIVTPEPSIFNSPLIFYDKSHMFILRKSVWTEMCKAYGLLFLQKTSKALEESLSNIRLLFKMLKRGQSLIPSLLKIYKFHVIFIPISLLLALYRKRPLDMPLSTVMLFVKVEGCRVVR